MNLIHIGLLPMVFLFATASLADGWPKVNDGSACTTIAEKIGSTQESDKTYASDWTEPNLKCQKERNDCSDVDSYFYNNCADGGNRELGLETQWQQGYMAMNQAVGIQAKAEA